MKPIAGLALILVAGLFSPALAEPAGESSAAQGSSSARSMFRNPQRKPTRERYKQIQLALKEKGYDPGPIDGEWGSKTSAALRRFERDNDLPPDGRLDALALIILGLGPKRLTSVSGGEQH